MMIKDCKCGKNNWEWVMDESFQSWIKCKDCNDNMFDKGIGVILINWDFTSTNHINIEDVLHSNVHNDGVVVERSNNE